MLGEIGLGLFEFLDSGTGNSSLSGGNNEEQDGRNGAGSAFHTSPLEVVIWCVKEGQSFDHAKEKDSQIGDVPPIRCACQLQPIQ